MSMSNGRKIILITNNNGHNINITDFMHDFVKHQRQTLEKVSCVLNIVR